MLRFTAAALVLAATVANAGTYNWRTGKDTEVTYDGATNSRYQTTKDYDGGATVTGTNFETGSTWKTKIEKDGDMNGTDADGNRWRYNSGTDSYMNYGTGEMRHGSAYFPADEK
jgi:hypothetical protein